MALLRLSNGEIFTDYDAINALIAPVKIGDFALAEDVKAHLNDPEAKFDRKFANYVFENVSPVAEAMMKEAGFHHKTRRIGIYVPPAASGEARAFITLVDGVEEVEPAPVNDDDFSAYLVPHRFPVYDWHFDMGGTMAKGLQLQNGQQAVLYIFAGEWMKLDPVVVNWPVFQSGSPIIGMSYFQDEAKANGMYDMELLPDFPAQDVMKF